MSTGSQGDQNKDSADWMDDPANADALHRLLWDILTLPDEMYDGIDPTGCAEPYDALSFPPGCSVDGGDCRFQATQHMAVYATYACWKNLRRSATGQRWREMAAKGGKPAFGITTCLQNGGIMGRAYHESFRMTKPYNRTADAISLEG